MKPPAWDILLITDELLPLGLVESVQAALQEPSLNHRVAVQLRAKRSAPLALRQAAEELRAITAACGVPLLINGALELARAVAAEGVHLPSRGPSPSEARKALGTGACIGRSCHDQDEMEFESNELDYITLSPFYDVPGKAAPLTAHEARRLVRRAPVPVVALGGINHARIHETLASGARGVAVMRAVLGAPRPVAALRELATAIDAARLQARRS